MKKFWKSKFLIILTVLVLLLTIAVTAVMATGRPSFLRNVIGTAAAPFQTAAVFVSEKVSGFFGRFGDAERLLEENEALKEQLRALEDSVREAELLAEENKRLYEYLELKREHIDFKLEPAKIIGRETGNYMTLLTLNRGTFHGVEEGMSVISSEGVVGYVCEAGDTWCKALSIIETASGVGAFIERTGETGLVEGMFALKTEGLVMLNYLPEDSDVRVGDTVITSGLGSVYPRGIVIGEVIELVPDPNLRTVNAKVRPAVELSLLHDVMIITDFQIYHG